MNKKKERELVEVNNQISASEAKECLRKAKEEQSKQKKEGVKEREKEMLDLHPNEIKEKQISNQKRKKILRRIKKEFKDSLLLNISLSMQANELEEA